MHLVKTARLRRNSAHHQKKSYPPQSKPHTHPKPHQTIDTADIIVIGAIATKPPWGIYNYFRKRILPITPIAGVFYTNNPPISFRKSILRVTPMFRVFYKYQPHLSPLDR
jgi:hypothetical protein